jgi:ankyrin repeat protein
VLVIAAHSNQGKVAEFLLDKDANPNASGAGYTALHITALTGGAELAKALLAHGANPNTRLTKATPVLRDNVDLHLSEAVLGATPFFLAAKFVEVDVMRALAAAGADAKLKLNDGTTPLMAAAAVGWAEASPSRNKYGRHTRRETIAPAAGLPPDEEAALACVKLALERGDDVNAVNHAGDTALHGAALAEYISIIQLLADKGANLNAQNKKGLRPLDLVRPKGKTARPASSTELLLRKLGAQDHDPQALSVPSAQIP